jgi:hypothetical protein
MTACLVLARNSIVEGNQKVGDIMSGTVDKAKVFDKVLVSMVNSCIKKINFDEAERVIF